MVSVFDVACSIQVYNVILIVALCVPVIDLDLDLASFGRVFLFVVLGYDTWGKLGLHFIISVSCLLVCVLTLIT